MCVYYIYYIILYYIILYILYYIIYIYIYYIILYYIILYYIILHIWAKSSILVGFSILNHPFVDTPMTMESHINKYIYIYII